MPCYRPIKSYRVPELKTANGKDTIVFYKSDPRKPYRSDSVRAVLLPCGKCDGCLESRTKAWALRCYHEAQMHEVPNGRGNCFVTLTFDDEHLDPHGSLQKSDFQNFMKRLRERIAPLCYAGAEVTKVFKNGKFRIRVNKKYTPWGVRYFHCGEYGSKNQRPHHHACLFNFDFPDKKLLRVRNGVKLYRSSLLEQLWPFGFSTCGSVTWESAAYVARYVVKKLADYNVLDEEIDDPDRFDGPIDEYVTMSRRPGIGKSWFDKYAKTDVYVTDDVMVNGKSCRPPRYYDKLFDLTNHEKMVSISEKRLKKAKENPDNSFQRLKVKEAIKMEQFKRLNNYRSL